MDVFRSHNVGYFSTSAAMTPSILLSRSASWLTKPGLTGRCRGAQDH
jgi:hypothetical protein